MVEDSEQGPRNGNASCKVTLTGRESVRSRSRLEEEQGKEDKDLGEDACMMTLSIDTESLKCSDKDQESGESVPKGEWKMDPEFVVDVLSGMVLLDDVEDMGDSRRDKECKDERDDVVASAPDVDVDGVEDDQQWEAPVDTVDDGLLAEIEELVDDSAEEKQVDDGPDTEYPGSRRKVGLLTSAVVRRRAGDGVDVAAEEEQVHHNVHHFKQDTVSPLSHVLLVVVESLRS